MQSKCLELEERRSVDGTRMQSKCWSKEKRKEKLTEQGGRAAT